MNRFELKGAIYGEPRLYGSGEKTVCKALVKAEKSFINVMTDMLKYYVISMKQYIKQTTMFIL